jgi:hypothetical protein
MSYTRVLTFTRPTITVPFYQTPTSTLEYFQNTYNVVYKITFSEDNLTRTLEEILPSKEDYDKFMEDPVRIEQTNSIIAYNTITGITSTSNTSFTL